MKTSDIAGKLLHRFVDNKCNFDSMKYQVAQGMHKFKKA